jgi:hypothetical protein
MPTKRNLPQPKPQDHAKHEPAVEKSLNPGVDAVRTRGTPGARQPQTRPASELKDVVRTLRGFTSDELRQIPVVVSGSRLSPGATYLDIRHPTRGAEVASEEMYAGKDSWLVPKSDVAPPFWNRLLESVDAGLLARDEAPRQIEQGARELRGGRERAERRGGAATSKVRAPARHHGARGH